MTLTPIFQELRQPTKNMQLIVGRTYHFSGFLEPPNCMCYETSAGLKLSIKACPSKKHQKNIKICKKMNPENPMEHHFSLPSPVLNRD